MVPPGGTEPETDEANSRTRFGFGPDHGPDPAPGTGGVTAALHARARSPAGLAIFGALTGLSALAALFLGILLAG